MSVERLAYRVPEFAVAIGVSRAKAYEMIAAGEVPSIRVGKSGVRVPVDALRAWVDRQLADRMEPASR